MTTTASNTSPIAMSSNDAVLALFEDLARTTWEWLGQARQLKLSFSEETVTDIAALHIAGAALNQIKVSKTTKQQEKKFGIDWMWFIGNPTQGYIRYAVQAKKVTLDESVNYSYRIRRRVKGIPGVEFQIELLEQFARKARAKPIYCFYNNVDQGLATNHWHCLASRNQPDDIRQMGCTLVPLDAIQLVHEPYRRKDFASIHRDRRSIPWRCLFHPTCVAASIHARFDCRQEMLADQSPTDESISGTIFESLPDFLLGDSSVVEFSDVIQQLDLAGPIYDGDSDADVSPSGRLAIPEWFVVIECESSQSTEV